MWQLTIPQRLRQLERRILELAAWRNDQELPVPNWKITQPGLEPREIFLGQPWGFSDGTHGYNTHKQGVVRFETQIRVPEAFNGLPAELELDLGGEGLVQISGAADFRGGLNPHHRAFGLFESASGGELLVQAEVVPKSLFGSRTDNPSLARAHLVVPQREVRGLLHDLTLLHQAATALEGHEAVPHLLNAAEDVLFGLDWTSNAQAYLSRLLHGTAGTDWDLRIYWSLPHIPELVPLEPNWIEGVKNAQAKLHHHLEYIRGLYPSQGQIALTGHAHIDLAWLWPISETQRKVHRTFGTVLELMKQHPDLKFNQSSAQAYAWLEQRDPAMFGEIQARVKEGRWEPIGGMWVEPDGQMLHGESWVRHIQYGQRYFLEKFGITSTVAWLPDTFGFNPQLPQLLCSGGIDYFFTTKLHWNETAEFPHDLFTWQGLDGSKVLAHCFWNQFDSYNAQIDPRSVLATWRNFKGKSSAAWLTHPHPPQSLLAYGYGDGGGGPNREHLDNYTKLHTYPALPKLETSRVDEFFRRLPHENLPVWHGELYLEIHRATLTTQGKVKKLHRFLEHRLLEAELLHGLAWLEGATYPQTELERLWKVLLLHQFHDILPGSSIREVYEDAHESLGAALEAALALRDAAPKNVALELALAQWHEAQAIQNFAMQPLEHGGYAMSAGQVSVRLSPAGWLESLVFAGREYLAAPVRLTYQHDVPREWEAWDINPPQTKPIESSVRFEPLASGVRVVHAWRDSSIVQDFRLTPSGVEVICRVDWNEKRTLLRAEFPTNIHCQHAHFETAFGVLERPNHPNTASQMAAFEVLAHRFVLLTEGQHSLAILNDCKYGFGLSNSSVTMSLLRGSMYPDPTADMGEHEFKYALDALGDQNLSPFEPLEAATERALEFNSPLLAAAQTLVPSKLVLSSLSKSHSDNALLLRLYEPCGVRQDCILELGWLGAKQVQKVDLLENVLAELEGQNPRLEVRAFEVVTLKIFFDEKKQHREFEP
jgi:alpha-mannosidase